MYFQSILAKRCQWQSPAGEREMVLVLSMSPAREGSSMLTQFFRDSEAAQCYLLALIASTFIHPFRVIRPFINFIHHSPLSSRPYGRLFLGSLPDYGMAPVIVTGPALFR